MRRSQNKRNLDVIDGVAVIIEVTQIFDFRSINVKIDHDRFRFDFWDAPVLLVRALKAGTLKCLLLSSLNFFFLQVIAKFGQKIILSSQRAIIELEAKTRRNSTVTLNSPKQDKIIKPKQTTPNNFETPKIFFPSTFMNKKKILKLKKLWNQNRPNFENFKYSSKILTASNINASSSAQNYKKN